MSARVDPARWTKLVTRRLPLVATPSRRSSSIFFSVRNLPADYAGNRQQARRFGAILRHGTLEPIFNEMPHAVDIYYPQWVVSHSVSWDCANSFFPSNLIGFVWRRWLRLVFGPIFYFDVTKFCIMFLKI